MGNPPKLSDIEMQEYVHSMGLQAFLRQIERAFVRAYADTRDFEVKSISAQYSIAAADVHDLRVRLFGENHD